MKTKPITRFRNGYHFLSNFYQVMVVFEGNAYPSVEHAYQAAKCADIGQRFLFFSGSSAQAKQHGRKVKLRPDWERFKLSVMELLLRLKFTPDTQLAFWLLKTGNAELIEGNQWGDTFWGVCGGQGQNHLGKLLMKIRAELREQA